ncbi:MAG: xanthine dehydrogenase accessory protein XdhC [Hyphomicrobiales bacterium]|nr:xanthine dehydrogenase accessory protein XdhC [Hyphomicrobiales bacterium]
MTDYFGIAEALKRPGPVIRIVVASIEGSTPREAGAAMLIGEKSTVGTIGGGQLEFEAIAHARTMLPDAEKGSQTPWQRDMRVWPLGPSLGQCCGGSVRVLFELFTDHERADIPALEDASLILRPATDGEPVRILSARREIDDLPLHVARIARDMLSGARNRKAAFLPARKGQSAWFIEPMQTAAKPLYIYGAGHVGRAIVRTLQDLPFAVRWTDVQADRFPPRISDGVQPIITSDPAAIASMAPQGAYHLVLTYSHALDLAICRALLSKPDFGFFGLIGSASKRARFIRRLREGGVTKAAIDRLTCPIGIGNLRGKDPATIAISVAAQLIERLEHERGAGIDIGEGGRDEAGRRISA